ncbi:hypothetical protein B566_EDAN018651, partial [Ephemera danica]
MSVSKLETIRSLVVERKQRHDLHTPPVKAVPEPTHDNELEATKAALETERKLRLLQMEAIKALWKEVQTLQPKSPRTPHAPGVGGGSNRDSGVDMSPLPSGVTEIGDTPMVQCTAIQQQPAAPSCMVPPASGSAVLELSRTCAILQGQ